MEHAWLSVSLRDREGISMCPAETRMRRGTTPGAKGLHKPRHGKMLTSATRTHYNTAADQLA